MAPVGVQRAEGTQSRRQRRFQTAQRRNAVDAIERRSQEGERSVLVRILCPVTRRCACSSIHWTRIGRRSLAVPPYETDSCARVWCRGSSATECFRKTRRTRTSMFSKSTSICIPVESLSHCVHQTGAKEGSEFRRVCRFALGCREGERRVIEE